MPPDCVSVTDPGLKAVRNDQPVFAILDHSVTDPGLKAVRNIMDRW